MSQTVRSFSLSAGLFSLAKWISLAIAILALIAAGIFALSSFTSQRSFQVPRFDSAARMVLLGNLPSNKASVAQQKMNLKLSQEYGSNVISIISKYNVSTVNEQQVIKQLAELPRAYRAAFVSGWKDYLENGIAYAKKAGIFQAVATSNGLFNQQPATADMLTQQYFSAYSNAVDNAERGKSGQRIQHAVDLFMAFSALMIFVLAIIVPILVQVERNTRIFTANAGTVAASAPERDAGAVSTDQPTGAPSKAELCPNCQQPISAGDAFCGHCGQRLT